MQGLFQAATLMRQKSFSEASRCGECGLFKSCKRPKLAPQGSGASRILIVLPETSEETDKTGNFTNGFVYEQLRMLFQKKGRSLIKECWITAATICHSKQEVTGQQVDACSFKLRQLIAGLDPIAILVIGSHAIRNVVQFTWRRPAEDASRFTGYVIPSRLLNAWIIPVIEPDNETTKNCSLLLFKKQASRVFDFCDQRPHGEHGPEPVTTHNLTVEEGERFLKYILKKKGCTAFDYETNSLKPEHERARIYTASFCWRGKITVAFPFSGNVPGLMKRFLLDPAIPKIASNLQFEHRWSRHILGVETKNWLWDTMQAAHALDNRRGVSSIKFQSYVQLGYTSYDDHIHQFLIADDSKGSDNHAVNQIQQIPLNDLLRYNALDSYLEYEVAKIQARRMKHPAYKEMK